MRGDTYNILKRFNLKENTSAITNTKVIRSINLEEINHYLLWEETSHKKEMGQKNSCHLIFKAVSNDRREMVLKVWFVEP
jgi:hypothetical protein